MTQLRREVLQTLLYYDIWRYPLTMRELLAFFPVRMDSVDDFSRQLGRLKAEGEIGEERSFYFLPGDAGAVERRLARARHARRMWSMARLSMHVIKRFPFVRGVFVSGDLSKNATHGKSDVDFLIITEPGRLWIARALLVLFKKVCLFNSRKFFCLNSFAASDHLEIEERNIYQATEIGHLKPLFNSGLFRRYVDANMWIRMYFPNFQISDLPLPRVSERRSFLQKILELLFILIPADRLDSSLLRTMRRVWAKRYPQFDEETRDRIFRCSKSESRAYVGNYQEKILTLYAARLRQHGILD